MKTIAILLTTCLLALIFLSCSNEEPTINKGDYVKIELGEKSVHMVEANNTFGLDLFAKVYADDETPENFMISPLSVSLALAMTYNGAETDTETAMQEALKLQGLTKDEINAAYKNLLEALLEVDPQVLMEIANSIWYRDGLNVLQSFIDVNQNYYDAEVIKADFNNQETINLINSWVAEKTHDKIEQIIDEIHPMTAMFLINAIYFKGTWAKEFNKEGTKDWNFVNDAGNTVVVGMMMRTDTLNFFKNEILSAIELPYGQGNYNMTVLLPNPDKSVENVLSEMTVENWKIWQSEFETTNTVEIYLPKFKVEFEIELKEILSALGMNIAFTGAADFSGITGAPDLYISKVKHKTFIEVDEEGTEAAAVTVVEMRYTSVDPNQPQIIPFHCDRPFLYAITEKSTGAILFIGKVGNPASEN